MVTLLVVLAPALAAAHSRSVSYSTWDLDASGARVSFRVPAIELTRLAAVDRRAAELPGDLVLRRGGTRCTPADIHRSRIDADGWVRLEWAVSCPNAGEATLESRLFASTLPDHVHLARWRSAGGGAEGVVRTGGELDLSVSPRLERGGSFVLLGVEHIARGWDHLAFLVALLLVAARFRDVAVLVSGFTIGHGASLAFAVVWGFEGGRAEVEVLIGATIVIAACEAIWISSGRDAAVRTATWALPLVAAVAAWLSPGVLGAASFVGLAILARCHFELVGLPGSTASRAALLVGFGLVHGLGFAGALSGLELEGAPLATALFGFNVGVELGQLALVAVVWPAVRAAAHAGRPRRFAAVPLTAGVLVALGVFWVVTRNWA